MFARRLAIALALALSAPAFSQTPTPPLLRALNPTGLYTQADLTRGFDAGRGQLGWDADVYRAYVAAGGFWPDRETARAESLHDDAIAAALRDYVATVAARGQGIVAVTGNALEDERCSAPYRQTVELGYQLARAGYLVSTGGGPGEMEAANLGAYLSKWGPESIDQAIATMRKRAQPSPERSHCVYATPTEYMQAAYDVLKQFPDGVENLGVPTWLYGHEPPNAFATRIAKFFSNPIREDVLLATATAGTIFTEGRAGLRQEIFQRASMNDFGSACHVTPLVFLGTKSFGSTGLYAITKAQASPIPLAKPAAEIGLTDSVTATIAFLKAHPAHRVDDGGGVCSRVP